MFMNRKKIVMAALLFTAAAIALFVQMVVSVAQDEAFKLEGVWIAKTTFIDLPGIPEIPFQWNYVLAPNPSGRIASIHGSVDVAFPSIIDHDFLSPLIGEVVKTGPNTATFNSIWYGIQKGTPIDSIAFIGQSWGQITYVEQGVAEAIHNFEIYLPESDVNGDGLPDGSPEFLFIANSLDTRLPSPAW